MLGRSRFRDRGRGSGVGGSNLLNQATLYLGGVAPYHWLDFINNRALYASVDVGNVTGATGYSFTRASDGYYTNSDGTLTLFGSGALRRGDRGVLIEGSRTNLFLRSQEFDNASWTKSRATVTANATTAPDGTLTAEKLVEDTTAANDHRTFQSVTTVAAAYTATVFAKAGERSMLFIRMDRSGGTTPATWFNLATGAVGTQNTGMTGSITALANGWYRCQVTLDTAIAGSNAILFGTAVTDGSFNTNGDGTSGLFLWGAQLEAASFPSSYIPTVAASATRAADVLTYTAGVSYGLSLWAEFERAVDTGGAEYQTQVRFDGNNRLNISVDSSDRAFSEALAGGTGNDVFVTGAIAINTVTKSAVRYGLNSVRMARGGTLGAEDTSAALPTDPTTWTIGAGAGSAFPAFGYIRRVAVVSSAVSDANLQVMTS